MTTSFATQSLFLTTFAPSPSGSPGSSDEGQLVGGDETDEREAVRALGSLKRPRSADVEEFALPVASTSLASPPSTVGLESLPPPPAKVRKTRGSKACQECRKVKAKCVGSDHPPCERCVASGEEVGDRNWEHRSPRQGEAVELMLPEKC